MCMAFGCSTQINFCHFFSPMTLLFLSLKHLDTGYCVKSTPSTVLLLLQFKQDLF